MMQILLTKFFSPNLSFRLACTLAGQQLLVRTACKWKSVFSMAWHKRSVHLDLRGIFVASTTPFNADESIAFDQLESNVIKWRNVPFRGFMLMGSTGEAVSLSHDERVDVVRKVRQMVPRDGNKLILAGPGCESTRETVKLAERYSSAGADAVVVVTPSYYKGRLSPDAVERHYAKVADACPVPVILYNVPMNTGIDLDPDVVIALSKHPNIIGVKDSGGDISKLAYMVYGTRSAEFQVFAGSAGFLMPALDAGCVGGILASAVVLGPQVCDLMQLVDTGKRSEACDLQHRLVAPNWAVTKKFGISGLKRVMDWMGFYGGPTRLPMLPLSDKDSDVLKKTFQASGFL